MAKPASRTVTKTKHRTAALRPGSVSPREAGQRPNHQAIADWQGRTTDELCEAIMRGAFLTTIADEWGMSLQSLLSWIASDPDRSTRAREARDYSGYAYDQQAEGQSAPRQRPFAGHAHGIRGDPQLGQAERAHMRPPSASQANSRTSALLSASMTPCVRLAARI